MNASYAGDLELARQCAGGDEKAWERFVLEYRPILYRAADALDPSGGARELADALYADLFGVGKNDAEHKSLFHYFQGRSSLATWLRAVLSQRYVDHLRSQRRLQPLPREDRPLERAAGAGPLQPEPGEAPDPERAGDLQLMQRMLVQAIADLPPKDWLRLACYYAQGLTLAETGRLLKEHEATASRQLARTRTGIRRSVERRLRDDMHLNEARIAQCFASVSEDPGPIDLDRILAAIERRKETASDRSR